LKSLVPLVIVAAAATLVALLAVLLPQKQEKKPATGVRPVNVEVMPIKPLATLDDTFLLQGAVEIDPVDVAAEVAGRIERYGVHGRDILWQGREIRQGDPIREGEPVDAGDVMLYLSDDLIQAEVNRYQAQYQFDQRELERLENLVPRGAATRSEVDRAAAAAQVSKALLDVATERLARTRIKAPVAGIVNELEEIGTYVRDGDLVAQIVDVERAKIVAYVPERDIHYLHLGDPVEIILGESPSPETIDGRITYIDELADPQTRTTQVEVTVSNPQVNGRRLRSGQIVRALMTRQTLEDVIMVPLEAVSPVPQPDGSTHYVVFVAERPEDPTELPADADGVASQRRIELGFIRGTQVRVLRGEIAQGDRLIVQGQRYVGPGQPIKIVDRSGQTPGLPVARPVETTSGSQADGS
jgi:membrane fusion protein (multidrug efflux system)